MIGYTWYLHLETSYAHILEITSCKKSGGIVIHITSVLVVLNCPFSIFAEAIVYEEI
jgi:hypothetical protein